MPVTATVTLPVACRIAGRDDVTELTLREPTAGELRGIKLFDLYQLDPGAIIKLLPRICEPAPSEAEAAGLPLSSLAVITQGLADFLEGPAPASPS